MSAPHFCRQVETHNFLYLRKQIGRAMSHQHTALIVQQPGLVRRIIGLLVPLTMTLGGATWVLLQALVSDRVFSNLTVVGCALTLLGAYWLWIDYIKAPTPYYL
jgi:hypothetical protein